MSHWKKASTGKYQRFHHIELVPKSEGVYIFIYKSKDSSFPEEDYLADDMEIAIAICEEDYDVPKNCWRDVTE